MLKDKWFSDDGYNTTGYSQIQARLSYLRKEGKYLKREEIEYEIRVIKSLLSLIPTDRSKVIYQSKLEEVLHEMEFKI